MNKKIIFLIMGIIIFILSILTYDIWSFIPKAITYYKADLDDYKIFDNREVRAGEYIPWEKSTKYNSYKIPQFFLDTIDYYKTTGFLVIQNDSIIFENYWNGYEINTLSNSFSVAKSIISLLVGIAIDEGKIRSVDQKVGDFIPLFSKDDYSKITIKHLLTMSSGLSWNESYSSLFSITTQSYYGNNLEKLIMGLRPIEPAGEKFKYLSGDTQILAFILEKATGKKVAHYASEKIWKHIGVKNNALWSLDKKNGREKAYCCFNSNARDFAKLANIILKNGYVNGKKIISSEYLIEATTPASNLFYEKSGNNVDFYGYQWWIGNHKGNKIIYARGLYGQYVMIVPDKNIIVIRLGEKQGKKNINNHYIEMFTYLDIAFDVIKNKE